MKNSTATATAPSLSVFEVYSESPSFITFKADNESEKVEFINVDKSTLYNILDGYAPLEEDNDWLERIEEDTLIDAAQFAIKNNWRYEILEFKEPQKTLKGWIFYTISGGSKFYDVKYVCPVFFNALTRSIAFTHHEEVWS